MFGRDYTRISGAADHSSVMRRRNIRRLADTYTCRLSAGWRTYGKFAAVKIAV